MATLDLKPLSKETIHKMGYNNHDLWVIKISEDVFGPFEAQSLKHYASENENQFISAQASRLDQNDWQPFYSYAIFSEARNQSEKNGKIFMSHEGPYWILVEGQKVGPLPRMAIEKKIEMGLLGTTELISYDDGHTWQKLYQIETFSHLANSSENLPHQPDENSFQRAKEELLEKISSKSEEDESSPQQSLATLAFLGSKKESTRLVNLEEIDVKSVGESDMSKSLKWALPVCVGFVAALAVIGYFIFRTPNTNDMAHIEEEPSKNSFKRKLNRREENLNLRPARIERSPASVPAYDRSSLTRPARVRDVRFPEPEINTHDTGRFPEHEEEASQDNMAENSPAEETEEHNLVKKINRRPSRADGNNDEPEAGGLDESMSDATNGALEEQPETPVMEEAGDF